MMADYGEVQSNDKLQAAGGKEDHTNPYLTSIGDFSTNSIRMKGIVDEVSAFARTFRNAKKVTGQD